MSWLDADRPTSAPCEGDGRSINGELHLYRSGKWVPCPTIEEKARAARRETRNPLLALAGVRALAELPEDTRATIAVALRAIQADARVRAEKSWRTHKAPMAVYWKAVGVYAGHLARVLR